LLGLGASMAQGLVAGGWSDGPQRARKSLLRWGGLGIGLILTMSFLLGLLPPAIEELVVVDRAVAGFALQSPLARHQRLVVLDAPPGEAIQAITHLLASYRSLTALHIVTHGSPGHLYLGDTDLDGAGLYRHRAELAQWQRRLRPQADLLLYGCEVAQGEAGQRFVQTLHDLTQADIAASTTPTGQPSNGGDWVLETTLGPIQTPLFPGLKTMPGVLKQLTVSSTADHGPGSLRAAIATANRTPEDDLISLESVSGTIALESTLPPIRGNLFLVGDGDDVLSGENAHRVLVVDQGDVTLQDLTIANGLANGEDGLGGSGGSAGLGGGLLINDGKVTLTNVHFVDNQAVGGTSLPRQDAQDTAIRLEKQRYNLNRGAIAGVNGIGIHQADALPVAPKGLSIDTLDDRVKANRGAIAGVNGIGVGGIGTIAFAGGGGFGGLGNAGNGGNGGNGGPEGGNGGHGGDGGNGGVGIFGGSGPLGDLGTMGVATFSGGGGLGGVGNAGNGGRGGNAEAPTASGGNGGSGGHGGNGGFGGGGGAGGFGGEGGYFGLPGSAGTPGQGGFGGGNGAVGLGGGGGGLGGAIFLKAGRLILHNTVFEQNQAIGGDGANIGQGKGGAIFVAPPATTAAENIRIPPQVRTLGSLPTFRDNWASASGDSATDNANWYGNIAIAGDR
jgi:hypothetical protein